MRRVCLPVGRCVGVLQPGPHSRLESPRYLEPETDHVDGRWGKTRGGLDPRACAGRRVHEGRLEVGVTEERVWGPFVGV